MGLYVTVCLLAGLTALESVVAVPGHVFGLVWGTTVGLALAHLFAFRLAGRLVHDGRFPRSDQIVSAFFGVAVLALAIIIARFTHALAGDELSPGPRLGYDAIFQDADMDVA
jgi:hypothetical protein